MADSHHNMFGGWRSTFDAHKIILKHDFSWISQEISIKLGTFEGHNLGKVVIKIRAQNISYIIFTIGKFHSQQLVAPIKKGARFFKGALTYYSSYFKS